jgi:hypothetical protein
MDNTKNTIIYWIRLRSHTDYTSQGYIGVTKRGTKRLSDHFTALAAGTHKNPHLTSAFKKYGLEAFVSDTLFIGEEKYCYEIEAQWRASHNVGWNIAPGGHRGPGWPKGKSHSAKTLRKIAETKAANAEFRKEASLQREHARIESKKIAKEAKLAEKQKELEQVKLEKIKTKEAKLAEKQKELERIKLEKIKTKEENNFRRLCPICHKTPVAINYIKRTKTYYRKCCDQCSSKNAGTRIKPLAWVKAGYKKKPHCEHCGFMASNINIQLNVFHLDGNLKNTAWSNLKTICLNCTPLIYKSKLPWKPSQPEA